MIKEIFKKFKQKAKNRKLNKEFFIKKAMEVSTAEKVYEDIKDTNAVSFHSYNPYTEKEDKRVILYLDLDDTVLASSEYVIDIINKRYGLNPPCTMEDFKDWNYSGVTKKIPGLDKNNYVSEGRKIINDIYQSDDFWKDVKFQEGFIDLYSNPVIRDNYKIIFNSKCPKVNLERKKRFLEERLGISEDQFIGRVFEFNENGFFDGEEVFEKGKEYLDIGGGIQVDDIYENLNTNASLKILIKNNHESVFNVNQGLYNKEDENYYEINNLKELEEILVFNAKNNNILLKSM